MTPHALDAIVGTIIFLSVLISYFRGLIKEAFTIAGLGLAAFVSYAGGHMLVPGVNKWLETPPEGSHDKAEKIWGLMTPDIAAKFVAYGGTFFITFLIMTLIGVLLTNWIKETGLGVADRALGAGFGLLRGFLLVFLFYVPFTYLFKEQKLPAWAKNSVSVPILEDSRIWANEHFDLDKKIEMRGSDLIRKIGKGSLDKLGEGADKAEEELKDAIKKEEKEIQKASPEQMNAPPPRFLPENRSQPETSPLP